MPATLTYPGVYIQELPSGVRTITGVATSVTAFVGRAWRGPTDEPVVIFSFADYQRQFGGLWRDSTMSYAVQQYFANGGSQAVIVRVATRTDRTLPNIAKAAAAGTIDLGNGNTLTAANVGTWASNLTATVDFKTNVSGDPKLFNLTLYDDPRIKADKIARGGSGLREVFLNVSTDPGSPRFVSTVLAQQSVLVRHSAPATADAPPEGIYRPPPPPTPTTIGDDGGELIDADVLGEDILNAYTGLYALRKTNIFNLLCLPPLTPGADGTDVLISTLTNAANFCAERRAFLLVDAPHDWKVSDAIGNVSTFSAIDRNHAAIYFPRLLIADPLQENKLESFAPCGVVAGVISRTDTSRGVWKAPAGIDATLQGVAGLSINGTPGNLTDNEVGQLNPLGINSLRGLSTFGQVVWGARTLEGADVMASQWKYIPIRRLALYIEESLFRGTQWVVFEPNDEPLWSQIRLDIGSFMQTLFRQGAFQGSTPKDAYFVKCNSETTTQTDIDNGVVNIIVGFAPLKPAEFVVIQIQQIASQP